MKRSFSWALDNLKAGRRLKRSAWDLEVYLFHVPPDGYHTNLRPMMRISDADIPRAEAPYLAVMYEQKVQAWQALQDDLLANDWEIIGE